MRTSTLLWSLAAVATGQASAASMSHGHAAAHRRMHEVENEHYLEYEKRGDGHIQAQDLAHLKSIGVISGGVNLEKQCDNVWIGNNGPYTNQFINKSGQQVVLVVWGVQASWVNAKQPEITVTIPADNKKTLSFSNGATGGWAVVGANTRLQNGQIFETWGEYTFGTYGVVDVSREVNMNGRSMAIHGPQCVSDMNRCVFVCPSGQNSCWQEYELKNCANGSQPGANYGMSYGKPSGGCGGMGSSAHLTTIIS